MKNSIGRKFNFFSLVWFAMPTVGMMIFMSLYTIVDGIFISRYLGSNALASANIIYPVFNIVLAVGIMLAAGGSAIVAKKLGEGKEQEARGDFSFLVVVGVVIGFLISIITILLLEPIVRMLGTTELLLLDAKIYLVILAGFAPVTILQLLFQTFFVTAGKPGLGLALTVLAGITNAVLDYVLIVPCEMGIAGAAIATIAGQLIPAAAGVIYFFSAKKTSLYFILPSRDFKMIAESCYNGMSEMVVNLSNAVITYLYNKVMLKLLGENGIAALSIVLYGQFLFNALYMGFATGTAPVISYQYGSKNTVSLKNIFKICMQFITGSSIVVTAAAVLLGEYVVGIFTPIGTETYDITVHGFFLFSFNYLFAGVNIFASAMFTAFSDGKTSAIISLLRTFVFIIASILILPEIIGINGVWLAIPLAECMTLFISVLYFYKKKNVYQYA